MRTVLCFEMCIFFLCKTAKLCILLQETMTASWRRRCVKRNVLCLDPPSPILVRYVRHCQELSRRMQLLTSEQLGVILSDSKHVFESDAVDEAAGKEARSAVPLERAFEPAVLTFLVHEHNVTLLQLQLSLALRRVRHHHTVPAQEHPKACRSITRGEKEMKRKNRSWCQE